MNVSKILCLVVAGLGLLAVPSRAAERPWQVVNFPTAAEVRSQLAAVPAVYGPSVTYGWDGPMTKEALVRDFDALKARGFRMVTIEAGYGLDTTPYLSDAWFEMIRFAVELAKERDMRVLIIDEGKYPSGFAGGKFSQERPDLRMKGIAVAESIPVAAGEKVTRDLAPNVIGVLAVNKDDNEHRRLPVAAGKLTWTAPAKGNWELYLVDHDFRTPVTRAVNDPTRGKTTANSMGDLINPEAVKQFIAWTHEGYRKHLGDEFGKTIMGFRGDEPDYAHLPFTPGIFERFKEQKGYDVTPYVASFISLPREEGQRRPRQIELSAEEQRAKADYMDVWSRMFADVFFGLQGEWSAEHGVEHTTHLNNEHLMQRHVPSTGDFFRAMRHVQIPGVDSIWNQVWPGNNADFVQLAASAAHMYGRPRALSESYAAYNQPRPPDIGEARWGVNYQLVRGINLFEFMFFSSSASRGRVNFRNYMGDDAFPALADYTNRAGYVLSQGRPAAKIGLYFPTMSMWLDDFDSNESLMAIADALHRHQRDFDFVDEQGLAGEFELEGARFINLSGQAYEGIIVPSVTAMSQATLDRLRQFAANGGRVVFLGRAPSMVVERSFLHATGAPDLSWAVHEVSGDLTAAVLAALPGPAVVFDQPAPAVSCLHRQLADADCYFFFNQEATALDLSVSLEGSGDVQRWNLQTGDVERVPGASAQGTRVKVPLSLAGGEARLLVVSRPGAAVARN